VATATIFSCTSSDGIDTNVGSSKSDCIEKELKIEANTLDDVAKACNAIRSEVLTLFSDNIGNCDKNGLSFDKPIGKIISECSMGDVTVVSSSSGSNRSSSSSMPSSSSLMPSSSSIAPSSSSSVCVNPSSYGSFNTVKIGEKSYVF
jgi:hypothetical protein